MDFFISAFNTILYQPLFNVLIFLYQYLPGRDFGIAVIVLTILIRIALYPLMTQSIKSQKVLSELQPKIQEIQQKLKNDKEKQAREIMALYQREKINPFSGCLPLLLQLPILLALFQVFIQGFGPEQMDFLYSFIPHPGVINFVSFGIINLGAPSIVMAVLAGIAQFFQSRELIPKTKQIKQTNDQMAQFSTMMQKQMLYLFPIFTVFILWRMPSALGLYWLINSLFSIGQQHFTLKHQVKK